jgi:hypothetical protein
MEECCAVLATKVMSLTLSLPAPMEWLTRFVRWWRSCGHDLVSCGMVTRVCGRGELAVALLVGESRKGGRERVSEREERLGTRGAFSIANASTASTWRLIPDRGRPLKD